MTKILIADDHEVVRAGLRALLSEQPNWQVVAEAADGQAAVAQTLQTAPHVAIVDYSLPLLNGVEVTRQIRQRSPDTEVIIFTMHDSNDLIRDLLRAGALGYVLKSVFLVLPRPSYFGSRAETDRFLPFRLAMSLVLSVFFGRFCVRASTPPPLDHFLMRLGRRVHQRRRPGNRYAVPSPHATCPPAACAVPGAFCLGKQCDRSDRLPFVREAGGPSPKLPCSRCLQSSLTLRNLIPSSRFGVHSAIWRIKAMVPVRDWGDAVLLSISQAMALFLAAIPKIIGFVIILAIGWMVASLVAKGAAALLRTVRFNDMAQRSGFAGFVRNTGVQTDSAGFIADIAKWFVRLIALVVAFDALGLPAVSDVLRQLLLWLPNLAVAIVVLIIGGLAANTLAGLVRGATAEADLGNPDLLANIARVAVWAFAIVVAVNQIGIARELVNTLFMATVGSRRPCTGPCFWHRRQGHGRRDRAQVA